jgi:hypothetical protein
VRLGFGYNFAAALEPAGSLVPSQPRGWYFTVSTKLSSLFDLFGTSADGLAPATSGEKPNADAPQEEAPQAGPQKSDPPPAAEPRKQ